MRPNQVVVTKEIQAKKNWTSFQISKIAIYFDFIFDSIGAPER